MATTFHGKDVFPDDHPLALGSVGFMRHDYVNFGFDRADVIIAVGYELQEFNPVRVNPNGTTKIIHVHRFPAEVDAHYDVAVGLTADISHSLDALAAAVWRKAPAADGGRIRELLAEELDRGQRDDRYPLAPARIVADTRAALGREDIVLVDTGALKMWMARLYPTYAPNTCLISNGLSTMAWTVPGAIGAKIARPDAKVLVATGDGSFLTNSQEIETALRLRLPIVILIWVDDAYGLISWKMDLEIGHNVDTRFGNPDFVAYAESFGARGYRISSATSCCPASPRARRRHGLRDRLPGRLHGQHRAHPPPRRPGRVPVVMAVGPADGARPAYPGLARRVLGDYAFSWAYLGCFVVVQVVYAQLSARGQSELTAWASTSSTWSTIRSARWWCRRSSPAGPRSCGRR